MDWVDFIIQKENYGLIWHDEQSKYIDIVHSDTVYKKDFICSLCKTGV